jgi:acyl-CoA thioester hydrolase
MQSQLIGFNDTETHVELRMYNADKSQLKAVMWGRYVHVDLVQQKRAPHSEELMTLFAQALLEVDQESFEQRSAQLRLEYSPRRHKK